MGGKPDRFFIPGAIGLAPFILLLTTWAPDGRSGLQNLVLGFYLPIVAIELFVVVVAVRQGLLKAMSGWSWQIVPSVALLALVAVAIVTALVAPNPSSARIWTFFWLLHLAFGFSVAHLAATSIAPRDLVAAYLIGAVAFVIGAYLFASMVRDPNFDWVRSWPAAAHIRHLGYYATAMIGLCIGLSATERKSRLLFLYFILNVGFFTFAFWTGSRGTVVGVVGAMLIGLILAPPVRRAVVWAGTAASMGLGILLATLLPAHGPLMGVGRAVTQTVESGDVSTGRTALWLNALGAIRKRPMFGYGESQMSTVAPFSDLGQTHNVILQILLAWGAVGLICVGILAIWFLTRSLPAVRRNPENYLPPFLAMLALATLATIDGSLYHVVPVSIFAACAGIMASGWHGREGPSR